MKVTVNSSIELLVRVITGGAFATVDYTIPAKAYIRKKATDGSTAINPLWDRKDDIRIKRENVQINLGVRYEKAVNGRLVKVADVAPDFSADALEKYGKTNHSDHHKNLCQNIARTKTYIRYMPMQNKNKTSVFLLDGKDVTAQLKPFMAKVKSSSDKQTAKGLDVAEQIQWRTLDIDNVDRLNVIDIELVR